MIKSAWLFFALLSFSATTHSQDIFIDKDTTLVRDWVLPKGTILRFGSGGHIRGKAAIRGGIIDAAIGQWIFDTTIDIFPEGTYGRLFSAKWFGAGYVKDNWLPLQKGINTVLANGNVLREFFIPRGEYAFGRPLKVQQRYKGQYNSSTIHLYGEAAFWDCCAGTTLLYTGTDSFALGLQLNKGSEINNLIINGQYKVPQVADSLFYNLAFNQYKDANGKCGEMYAGIVIDYDGTVNSSGSTGIKIHDMKVSNFSIDYLVSPNGKTFNAEILIFENIRCGDAKVGFASGQAQEKGNMIRGIYSWGSIHTLYSCGRYGKSQAGNYTIDGGNIAGRCIRLFDMSQSGWYSTSIQNIFAESIGSIGSISTGIPISISNSTFHFAYPSIAGRQVLFTGNSDKINFTNCIFRYYGLKDPMKFKGYASFNNCFFSGPVQKD